MANNSDLELKKHFEIMCTLRSLNGLLQSQILWSSEKEIYRYAVFTEVLVHLNFLLVESNRQLGKRVSFTDDIKIHDDIKDVTDLIRNFRNAACHIGSELRSFGDKNDPLGKKSFFSDFHGKNRTGTEPSVETIYNDDVGFICGLDILYLKRHIERAYQEVWSNFKLCFSEGVIKFILQQ